MYCPHYFSIYTPPLSQPPNSATTLTGPAILIQDVSTVVVEPGCTATVTSFGDVAIEVGDVGTPPTSDGAMSSGGGGRKRVGLELDPVYLSIFAHRFMGIAEQMGRTLQVGSYQYLAWCACVRVRLCVCVYILFCGTVGGVFVCVCV